MSAWCAGIPEGSYGAAACYANGRVSQGVRTPLVIAATDNGHLAGSISDLPPTFLGENGYRPKQYKNRQGAIKLRKLQYLTKEDW